MICADDVPLEFRQIPRFDGFVEALTRLNSSPRGVRPLEVSHHWTGVFEGCSEKRSFEKRTRDTMTRRFQSDSPTLVFPNGTCRVPILHPPAPKVLVWNVSRSKIAPCGCKVPAPGTRRECRSVPTPWNPSRTLNRAPSSKLPSWNASRLSHSSSHSICILRIEYNHVIGLWPSTPLGFLRNQSCLPSAKGLLGQRQTRYAVRAHCGGRPPDGVRLREHSCKHSG